MILEVLGRQFNCVKPTEFGTPRSRKVPQPMEKQAIDSNTGDQASIETQACDASRRYGIQPARAVRSVIDPGQGHPSQHVETEQAPQATIDLDGANAQMEGDTQRGEGRHNLRGIRAQQPGDRRCQDVHLLFEFSLGDKARTFEKWQTMEKVHTDFPGSHCTLNAKSFA
jgi:hypothetical protein